MQSRLQSVFHSIWVAQQRPAA